MLSSSKICILSIKTLKKWELVGFDPTATRVWRRALYRWATTPWKIFKPKEGKSLNFIGIHCALIEGCGWIDSSQDLRKCSDDLWPWLEKSWKNFLENFSNLIKGKNLEKKTFFSIPWDVKEKWENLSRYDLRTF